MGNRAPDDQKQLPSAFQRTVFWIIYPAMARYLREPPGALARLWRGPPGRAAAFQPPSPLRTLRETFTSQGSSIDKAPLSTQQQIALNVFQNIPSIADRMDSHWI